VIYGCGCIPRPRYPVGLALYGADTPTWCRVPEEPRPVPAVPPVGCARFPYQCHKLDKLSHRAATTSVRATDTDHVQAKPGMKDRTHGLELDGTGGSDGVLQQLWDAVLGGLDYEIAGRHGKQFQKTARVFYDILGFLNTIGAEQK
ncbi:unnamed protein product, partial [Prorocentrum cordatum]